MLFEVLLFRIIVIGGRCTYLLGCMKHVDGEELDVLLLSIVPLDIHLVHSEIMLCVNIA